MWRGVTAPLPLVGDFCVFVSRRRPFQKSTVLLARIHLFASSCSIHRNSGRSAGSPVRLLRDLLQRKISSIPAFGLFKAMRLRFWGSSSLRKQKLQYRPIFCFQVSGSSGAVPGRDEADPARYCGAARARGMRWSRVRLRLFFGFAARMGKLQKVSKTS